MKRITSVCAVAMSLWGIVANASIINGSFENHPTFTQGSGTWGLFNAGEVPGWNPEPGTAQIEIGRGSIYGITGYDGLDVMELDSTANVVVSQIVATPGGSYTLSFLFALRGGIAPSSGSFDVYWNNNLVQSFTPTSSAMLLYSTTVNALLSNTLTFKGAGTSDSYGALIDKVELAAVPEPTTMIAGALLLLPFGASAIRFIRKNRTA